MLYDYICKDCQKSFELVFTLGEHDIDNIICPKCKSKNVEQDPTTFLAVTSMKSWAQADECSHAEGIVDDDAGAVGPAEGLGLTRLSFFQPC